MATFDFHAEYIAAVNHFPNHQARPLIGITGNFGEKGCELAKGYFQSVENAGGIPVVIPPVAQIQTLLPLLDQLDGILLSGGADVNPLYFGEEPIQELHGINPERDACELLLVRFALDRQLPLFGICRGMQLMTAVMGGKLYQDLNAQYEGNCIKHDQNAPRSTATHFVTTEPGSLVEELLGERIAVNSFHHQAVADCGPQLKVSARSVDGVIEAVESNAYKSILGVQWHPETFITADDHSMTPLFEWFTAECNSYRQAKKAHSQILTLDSHTDTPMFFPQGVKFNTRDPKVLVDLHKLNEGHVDAVIMVAYLPQKERNDEACRQATAYADELLDQIVEMVHDSKGAEIAYTPKNAFYYKNGNKKSVYLGIENGYAIGRDLEKVEYFRRKGVVYMTLCHNGDNDICDSAARSQHEHNGLSDFGREVVAEMNRTGMMIDLSHAAESSFYDVLECSAVAPVCSHSSSRALCDHPRNLTDDQLRALAAAGGVAQATFYHGFLRESGEATVLDVVRHIMHMIDVAGIDHVGIGSDFDGDGGVRGLASEAEMLNLTRALMSEGLTIPLLRKLWGGNFLRVMTHAQQRGCIKF